MNHDQFQLDENHAKVLKFVRYLTKEKVNQLKIEKRKIILFDC